MIARATGRTRSLAIVAACCLWLHAAACGGSDLLSTNSGADAGDAGVSDGTGGREADGGTTEPDATVPTRDANAGTNDAGALDDGGSDAGSAGPPGATGALLYIKASNPDAQDWFGEAVALSDRWLAVGAFNESSWATGLDGDQADDSEDSSGAVYLFANEGSGWAQRHYVKASNTGTVDGFGRVLALHEATLAVGAPYEDSPATGIDGDQGNGSGGNHGAVYVFVEADGVWRQEAYVKASNTDAVDLFGHSVALENDTLVVGAPYEDSATGIDGDQTDNSVQNCGAAYVFERTAAGWVQTAYLKASDPEADDEFGYSIAISGSTIAVGARGESSSGTGVDPASTDDAAANSGAVYVFERDATSYRQTALLKASDTAADAHFGSVVALDGDTLAVGATGPASGARSESGAAYIFERDAATWSQTAYLEASDPIDETWFGVALALEGDTLLVGAIGDGHPEKPRSGAAYVFARSARGWDLQQRVLAPNAEINDRFGAGLAITPSLMAIGANGEASDSAGIGGDASNNRTPGAGAVFLYTR